MSHAPNPLREERKVVTALFADVVGSTALGEQLDAEDVKLVVGDAVARIVREVESFGGHVKDLAGDGVLAFFGAPLSYEDDAERAVRAGLAITAAIDHYSRDVASSFGVDGLGVRVGIATGAVVLGEIGAGARIEYAAFGDTVNTAARLQSAAEPGTIVVDTRTRRLAEPLFEWSAPSSLQLKGKAAATQAFTVAAARPAARRQRGLGGLEARLVGRERELDLGGRSIDAVVSGSGGVLFVTGEAGVGKSRLLAELRARFDAASIEGAQRLWLDGRCVSYGESLPYWPFRDLLREWLGVGANEPELRVRIALRRSVDRLFVHRAAEIYPYLGALLGVALEPDAAARLEQLSPEALQYRTFEVVGTLLERLAADGPVVVAIEDLHWADATSVQLVERLLGVAEDAALLLIVAQRGERDHASWAVKEVAAREFPHLFSEVVLEPLAGDAPRELLHALVGATTLPAHVEDRLLTAAEGNPFYVEELVRSLTDAGALVREDGHLRFDHEAPLELPESVEKVILARIDRLPASCHDVLTAASALGRRFGLPLLEGVVGADGDVRNSLHELQRLDLIRAGRRWPQPEYQFKHVLIQEAAYRTLVRTRRTSLHRRAAEWLETGHAGNRDEVLGLLAHHWLAAEDEDKALAYLLGAGDKARQEYALDEAIGHYRALLPLLERRGEEQASALVLFKLALALHTSLRFADANAAYRDALALWRPPTATSVATEAIHIATSFLPNDPDPKSAIAWPNIQLCMQLFDRLVEQWPERTIVPSLAEHWEIAPDGLRYLFRLREGLSWSDGTPLTAHDVEFGIKRVLDPAGPGSSVAIYFVVEHGQDYCLGRHRDAERIGVRALDERTVEFRLAAPAPYFMSVMNRPDGGPQPRHAIETHGDRWTAPELQVVSGAFRQVERTPDRVVLERRGGAAPRTGNVARVELRHAGVPDALAPYEHDELDVIATRYTPRTADLMPKTSLDTELGPAGWSAYLAFDHSSAVGGNLELRRALAHAIDRAALGEALPVNVIVANGGVVPPALQGHTPDIVLAFDPARAREHLAASAFTGPIAVAGSTEWKWILERVADGWRATLGIEVDVVSWSDEQIARFTARRLTPWEVAPIVLSGWLPGYPDPEYFLRLLLHSDSRTNEGGFAYPPFDELIERARQERSDRARLELFHEADRMAVGDRVALIPLAYGRSMAFVKPRVKGWWEFGKTSANFADLVVEQS